MAHGYLGDGYGAHGEIDPDRGDDRERWRERGWRDGDDEWRERRSEHRHDHGRGMMFGRSDNWSSQQDWTGDRSERGFSAGRERGAHDDNGERRQNLSASPDDHYRSWRDRHLSELDRDYADYCREREQQFHREFDDWRRQKHGNPQPLRTGMTQSGISHDPSGELELTNEAPSQQPQADPMAEATLGTNSSEESSGRSRSRR